MASKTGVAMASENESLECDRILSLTRKLDSGQDAQAVDVLTRAAEV